MYKFMRCYWPPVFVVVLVFIVMILNGCASQPIELSGGYVYESAGIATLADANDPVEMTAAAAYTNLAAYRHRAAKLLRNKQINVDQGKQALADSDDAKQALDKAVASRNLKAVEAAKQAIDQLTIKPAGKSWLDHFQG